MNEWDLKWIEDFYEENERLSGRPRPEDYLERGKRILERRNNPVGWKTEGLTKKRKPYQTGD